MADNASLAKEKTGVEHRSEFFPVEINDGHKSYRARGCRLTTKGVSCVLDSDLSLSSPVEIKLILPSSRSRGGDKEVICRATPAGDARGSGEGELKFSFKNLPPSTRAQIRRYLSRPNGRRAREEDRVKPHHTNLAHNGVTCKAERQFPLFQEVEVQVEGVKGYGDFEGEPLFKLPAVVVDCRREKGGKRFDLTLFFTEISEREKRILSSRLPRVNSRNTAAAH